MVNLEWNKRFTTFAPGAGVGGASGDFPWLWATWQDLAVGVCSVTKPLGYGYVTMSHKSGLSFPTYVYENLLINTHSLHLFMQSCTHTQSCTRVNTTVWSHCEASLHWSRLPSPWLYSRTRGSSQIMQTDSLFFLLNIQISPVGP